jgi:hypothetical protein
MKEENLSILQNLKQTIEELVPPLESEQTEFYGENQEDRQSGLDLLMSELTMMVVVLTNADIEIAPNELELLNDMRQVVYGDGIPMLTSNDYQGLFEEFLQLYPNKRLTLDHVPASIRVLRTYDEKHNTGYAARAVNLFIQFGEAVVKADQNQDFTESVLLENFIEILKER